MNISEEDLKSKPEKIIQLSESLITDSDLFEFCYLGGCKMLVSAMSQKENSKLDMFLPLLNELSKSYRALNYCCYFGLIPLLLRMFDNNEKIIQLHSLSFLSRCSFCDENVIEIVKHEGIYKCITLIRWSPDKQLKTMAISLLGNLCFHFGMNFFFNLFRWI